MEWEYFSDLIAPFPDLCLLVPCYNCAGEVESEMHVLLYCPVYQTLREDMLATLTSEFSDIDSFTDDQKAANIFKVFVNMAKSAMKYLVLDVILCKEFDF